jgi:hypothetical protein
MARFIVILLLYLYHLLLLLSLIFLLPLFPHLLCLSYALITIDTKYKQNMNFLRLETAERLTAIVVLV